MPAITNIAAYRFAKLTGLKELREDLLAFCRVENLKGTILLSTEGVNLFLAGTESSVRRLLERLRTIPGLEQLKAKFSDSDAQPFHRMLVRIKKEIIAFGVEGIDPVHKPSPRVEPRELKQWLDEGRPVTLLDTRNRYEVKLGTFRSAVDLGIDHFRDFPKAVATLSPELKKQPIVMFCTGGIRCEKAGPYMEQVGFEQIYQLDGGILKYFEDCGDSHYDGECFVFDYRVGLDASLHETASKQCFACLAPLTPEDQADPRYAEGKSCPHCYCSADDKLRDQQRAHQAAIDEAVKTLPGSVPYLNARPLRVSQEFDGKSLLDFLSNVLVHIPRDEWKRRCLEGLLVTCDRQPVSSDEIVRAGSRFLNLIPMTVEPDVSREIRIHYEDEAILVIDKPAPLAIHPCGRFHRNTLQYVLDEVYSPQHPRPAHRLDANTTGLVVFSRTRHIARRIQPQFERGTIAKEYLARVIGHPPEETFTVESPIATGDNALGAAVVDHESGLPAKTEFRVLDRSRNGTALLRAVPLTGRTNQIRVHLWHAGWPIVGDPTYLPQGQLGLIQTLPTDAPPMCLRSQSITFDHPLTGKRVRFDAPLPDWS